MMSERMGQIGEPRREIVVEPVPEQVPVEPVKTPEQVPVPA